MAGSTTYPTSVDNKTALQDGVDIIQADDVNDAYVPIDAIETFVGTNGKGSSWSSDVLDTLFNAPCTVKKASASSITVSVGLARCKNSGQTNRLMRRNTSTTNVTASNLTTGAMAVGWYYIYAVADSAATTFTVKFDVSETAPTGLTNFELIGAFYNETGGVLDITSGFVFNCKRPGVRNTWTTVETTDTSTSSTSFVSCPPTLKAWAPSRRIKVIVRFKAYAGSNEYWANGISVDGTDETGTQAWEVAAPSVGISGKERELTCVYAGAIAANTCTLIPRLKSGDVSYTPHVVSKTIEFEELEAA